MGEMNNVLQETFSGIRIVKAFAMEPFEIEKFKTTTRRLLRVSLRWVRAQAVSSPLMEILGPLSLPACSIRTPADSPPHADRRGTFSASLYAAAEILRARQAVDRGQQLLPAGFGASEQVFHYLDSEPDMVDKPDAITAATLRARDRFRARSV